MTGSIGSINIKESKPLALDNFILTNEFKTSIMHNHDSMQIDCEDHDNAFMADNPFELVDDVKPGFRQQTTDCALNKVNGPFTATQSNKGLQSLLGATKIYDDSLSDSKNKDQEHQENIVTVFSFEAEMQENNEHHFEGLSGIELDRCNAKNFKPKKQKRQRIVQF